MTSLDWRNVADLTQRYVADGRLANMVVYLGQGEAQPVTIAEGRDTKGGRRHSDADSLYRIYSMTKPVTGMATMILIADGRLDLDQPLAEILPKFADLQVQKDYDGSIASSDLEPARNPILIRHLLTHTAGLAYSIVQQGPVAELMRENGVVSGQISKVTIPELDRGQPVPSLMLFADRLADIPLVYQPGTRWSYSPGLDVLGRVIEVITGQEFGAFLQERIFDPCGMPNTYFQVPAGDLDRLTMSYAVLKGDLVPIDPPANSIYSETPPFPFGGSGLVSSPRDYDRFLKMIGGYGMLEGKRVLDEQAVRIGTSNLLPDTVDLTGSRVDGFGFGAGGRIGAGNSKRGFGWAGAAGTIGFVDMETGLRAGLYTQYMPSWEYPIPEEFERAISADRAAQKGST